MKTIGIGFYWDDLSVGDRFRTLNRTITEPDIVGFIGVTGMVETIFTDLSFNEAGHGAIQGRVVPAACTYTIIEGLLCQAAMQTTGLALLEVEKKVLKPVFAGDTVHAEVEVIAIRPTSKGNRGIVTTTNDVINQNGETVNYLPRGKDDGGPAGGRGMRIVNIRQAKTQLSRLLAQVEAGEEVLIARRGKPAAQLVACKPRSRRPARCPQGEDRRARGLSGRSAGR